MKMMSISGASQFITTCREVMGDSGSSPLIHEKWCQPHHNPSLLKAQSQWELSTATHHVHSLPVSHNS